MQVCRVQALDRGDRDRWVLERLDQWRDDIAGERALRLEDDDDLAAAPTECSLERISGSECHSRADDLVCRSFHGFLWPSQRQDLRARGSRVGEGPERGVWRHAGLGDDDHRSRCRGRLVELRRNRFDGAMECALTLGDVGWSSGLQVVAGAEVDDLPASRLDAGLELVGGVIVPLGAGGGSLVGERDDVVGY